MPEFEPQTPPRLAEAPFGRVITAMVTPFSRDGGRVDLESAGRLARYLVTNGSDGLVVAGTTGESPTLTHKEQRDLFRAVRDSVDVPILAGTGSNSTREAAELTEYVTNYELADGLLVVSPYYNRPPQSGIYDYYRSVARATDLPIVMYNIPIRTGRGVDPDTMLELANDFPNIKGLKDAAGDPEKTVELIGHPDLPEGFVVYSGDDGLNLRLARAGSVGAISVASHWAGKEIGAMYDAHDLGNDERADAIDAALQGSYAFETSVDTPNPIPAKAMMRAMGRAVGLCRSPLVIGSDNEKALERQALAVHRDLELKFKRIK